MVEFRERDLRSPKITQQDTTNRETPIKDKLNYRRHRGACPFYRENWSCESESDGSGGQLMYQIICLMDTPPVTPDEQPKCLHSPTSCWRLAAEARRNGRNGHHDEGAESTAEEEAEGASPLA